MSMEASTYYGCLDEQTFMDQFDVEMTYRLCSHLPVRALFWRPPLPRRRWVGG